MEVTVNLPARPFEIDGEDFSAGPYGTTAIDVRFYIVNDPELPTVPPEPDFIDYLRRMLELPQNPLASPGEGYWIANVGILHKPVVVVVRDDASNEYTVQPEGSVTCIDVDLGYATLSEENEFLDWAVEQFQAADQLGAGAALKRVLGIIDSVRGTWHADRFPDLAALRRHLNDEE